MSPRTPRKTKRRNKKEKHDTKRKTNIHTYTYGNNKPSKTRLQGTSGGTLCESRTFNQCATTVDNEQINNGSWIQESRYWFEYAWVTYGDLLKTSLGSDDDGVNIFKVEGEHLRTYICPKRKHIYAGQNLRVWEPTYWWETQWVRPIAQVALYYVCCD